MPLEPRDKIPPAGKHGYLDATDDPDVIAAWWGAADYNIGLAPSASGFVVIDVDPRNGGLESMSRLANEGKTFPLTLTVATGSGGLHFYFKDPGVKLRGLLDKGIDVKSRTGHIVAPPSIHPNGLPYQWANQHFIADPPAWLVADLVVQEPPTRVQGEVDPNDDRPGSVFNQTTTWEEVLEPLGWVKVGFDGDITYWRRPGKSEGISASTNYAGSDLLWVWTTSTEFDADVSYTKFGAYTLLNHGGDYSAAGQALAALYAPPPPPEVFVVSEQPQYAFGSGFPEGHFISRYIEYANQMTDAASEYHEACALSLLSMMTPMVKARLAPYPGGLKTNLYLLLCGSSTRSRKSTSQRIALELLRGVLPGSMLPSKMTTEVLIAEMGGRPDQSSIWAPDEFGVMLSQIYSVGFLGGIEDVLLQLYGGEDFSYVTLSRSNVIRRPHLSILGAATPESVAFAGPQAMLGGLLPRFGVVFPSVLPPAKAAAVAPDVSVRRSQLLADLRGVLAWQAQGVEVTFTPDALAVLNSGESLLVDQGVHAARLPTMLYKVATLSAASRRSSVVEAIDAGGAVIAVRRWRDGAEHLQPFLRRKSAEIEFEAKCLEALDALDELGGVAHRSQVARQLRLSKTTFEAIEGTLQTWAAIDYDRVGGTWTKR